MARPRLAVVLCHGFGAPGEDLVPLADELMARNPGLADGVRFVFPQAPLSLEGLGYPGARAWWLIDLERRMRLTEQGAEGELADELPAGLPESRRMLLSLLEALTRTAELPMGGVVLGGFSQGAMLATEVALSLEEAPAGLALLSGTLVNRAQWQTKALRRRGLPVFQSHGRQDPVLAFSQAEGLCALLTSAGLEVSFHPFDGGHTIPLSALAGLGKLLERRLAAPPGGGELSKQPL